MPLQVVGSAPDPDARVGSMPVSVSVLFNQAVRNATLRVLGPHGNRVDLDGTTVSGQGGRSVAVTTQDGGTGGYLVAWSAVPAESGAAVSGALAFAVGRVPAWSTSGVAQYLSAGGAGPGLAAVVNVVEGVELAGLLILVGLVVALTGRWLRPGRGPYTAVSSLLAIVGVAAATGLVLRGPFAAGLPIGDAMSRSMARATLHSAWGIGGLLALAGVVLIGAVGAPIALRPAGADNPAVSPVDAADTAGGPASAAGGAPRKAGWAHRATCRRSGQWTDRVALAGAAAMVAAAVAVGHSVSEGAAVAWTALVVVHVLSAVALAGLLVIRVASSRRHQVGKGFAFDPKLLRATVIAVAVTGLVLAAHDLGAISAITGTAYGRILIAKATTTLALLLCVYSVAKPSVSPARRRLPARRTRARRPASARKPASVRKPAAPRSSRPRPTGPEPTAAPSEPTAARTEPTPTRAEPTAAQSEPTVAPASPPEGGAIDTLALSAVLFLAVAFITALLVFQTPGRIAAPRTVTGTLATSQMYLEYQVTPAHVGANNVHLYVLNGAGSPMSVPGATASLAWSAEAGSPLPIALSNAGPGHYLEYNFEVPLAGTWTLRVNVDSPDTGMPVPFTATVHIRP